MGIIDAMKKKLITSALPYVNNVPHLGNLTQVLSADVFARFCRLRGYDTLYVCGTDEYGTATETRALKEGVTPRELCDRYHKIHSDIYKWFNISFDYFGRTSTPKQTEIVQEIFKVVDKNGYINEAEQEQLYCPKCERFLADRFVEGTCPHCGAHGARGDQCDSCQTLLDPTELVEPHCSVCGTAPVVRKTKHLYLDLPKVLPLLEKWKNEASVKGFWANNALQVTNSWIRDGLKERCITRDLKWGIPVPKPGFEGKVFYVWFDAPIGYISISASCTDDWKSWWQNPDEVELFQFIGKDNIPFHTVLFPSTLLATGQRWTMLHHMSSTEYLNYEGGKFSKSKGIGIFGNDVQSTGIPADVWRFYMFYNRPEHADVTFTWKDFQENVNGELIGNLSNLVNRTLTFVKRFYDSTMGEGELDEALMAEILKRENEITGLLDASEERSALRAIFALSSVGNKAFQDGEPWKARNEDPRKAQRLLRTLMILIRDLGVMIQPYVPDASMKLLSSLGCADADWSVLGSRGALSVGEVSHLFDKLDGGLIADLRQRFSGSQAEREGRQEDDGKQEGGGRQEDDGRQEGGGRQEGDGKGKVIDKDGSRKEAEKAENKAANKAINKAINKAGNKEGLKMADNKAVDSEETMAQQFARRVTLIVSRIEEVARHPNGDMLYILTLDTGAPEKRTIVSSVVPYYKEDELLGKNIVLVDNLKPANFRGVKSYGMLLAASDKDAEPHATCEVLFAPQFPVGTHLTPEGIESPDEKCYVKADAFFAMPMYAENGTVKVDGKAIGANGTALTSVKYLDGPVG